LTLLQIYWLGDIYNGIKGTITNNLKQYKDIDNQWSTDYVVEPPIGEISENIPTNENMEKKNNKKKSVKDPKTKKVN
jgi:hypothetical protein